MVRRCALVVACTFLVCAGSAPSAGAGASDRACVGQFVSGLAHDAGGAGHIVSGEAQTIQPFGAIVVSPFARTCEFVGGG